MAQAERIPEPFPNQPIETPAGENVRMRVETAYVSSSPEPLSAGPPEAAPDPRRLLPSGSSGRYWRESLRETLSSVSDLSGEAVRAAGVSTQRALRNANTNLQSLWRRGRENTGRYSEEASRRFEHYANEEPLRVIAAAAAGGLVLGIVLRIWRSSRYE